MSPYERRRDVAFDGQRLPFGIGVFYYPNKTKYKHQYTFSSRFSFGILVGYGVTPGNNWAGTYLVVDFDEFF